MIQPFIEAQRFALAGVIIGSLLCLVGVAFPYWVQTGSVNINGNMLLNFRCGLWRYCGTFHDMTACSDIDLNFNVYGSFQIVRGLAICTLLLGTATGVLLLALVCYRRLNYTFCIGLLCLLAAILGSSVIGVFLSHDINDLIYVKDYTFFDSSSYGWTFDVFCVGVGILAVSSYIVLFSAPNPPAFTRLANSPSGVISTVTNVENEPPLVNSRVLEPGVFANRGGLTPLMLC